MKPKEWSIKDRTASRPRFDGQLLRELREEAGLSLATFVRDLERKTGCRVSIAYISQVERLDIEPGIPFFHAVAYLFGMPMEFLVTFTPIEPEGTDGN